MLSNGRERDRKNSGSSSSACRSSLTCTQQSVYFFETYFQFSHNSFLSSFVPFVSSWLCRVSINLCIQIFTVLTLRDCYLIPSERTKEKAFAKPFFSSVNGDRGRNHFLFPPWTIQPFFPLLCRDRDTVLYPTL